MKKEIIKILIMVMLLIIAFPCNLVFAGADVAYSDITGVGYGSTSTYEGVAEKSAVKIEYDIDNIKSTENVLMRVVSDFLISMGDYANDYLTQLLKEEITIDKIVYNRVVMLNANFFESNLPETSFPTASSNAATIIKTAINTWFGIFRSISLVVIIMMLIVAGMKMMLGTPGGKVSAYEIGFKVVTGVMLIFLFPFVMKYAFEINQAIINMIYEKTHTVDAAIGVAISPVSDLLVDELEERSPQYVSSAALRVSAGSKDATQLYINQIYKNASTGDVMRIMRAFAGATYNVVYVGIWYIMLIQTYVLIFIYIKRFIVIAFLIAVYPLVVMGYITGVMFGNSQDSFNRWCGKFFSNVFLQTLHAVIYGVISGILISQVRDEMINSQLKNINFILMIIATSFLFSGEKILTKFWRASIDAETDNLKKSFGNMKKGFGQVKSLATGWFSDK